MLFNPYGVITVNGDKGAHIQTALATEFVDWLVSMDTQGMIAEFGVAEFGAPLFTPDSTAWREALAKADSSGAGGAAALKVGGLVSKEMSWTEDELKAMEITQAKTENSKGEVDTYEGVLFSTLLDLVKPAADATTLVLVADDGYSVEVSIADVIANGCIVAFRTNGGFRSAMPGMGGATNVKGLIEIQVK